MDALELMVDEGRPANAVRFFHLGVDLLELLDELSEVPVAWRVTELRLGSALVQVAPPIGEPAQSRVLRLALRSLREVHRGGDLPDGWTPDAVRVAHRLVEDGQRHEGESYWEPSRLRLVTAEGDDGPGVDLTPELGARLADLQPFERRMPGAVRGTLVGLNVSRGNRASLRMPGGRVVRVAFGDTLREVLKDALYQDVELVGEIRQDGDGRVFHLRADDVSPLVRPATRWADLYGIDPDYTDGVPVDVWLEAGRGQA